VGTSREVVFFSQNSTFQMWESSPNVFLKTSWGLLPKKSLFLQRHINSPNLRVMFPQTLYVFFFKKTLFDRNEMEVQLFFLRYLGVLWLKIISPNLELFHKTLPYQIWEVLFFSRNTNLNKSARQVYTFFLRCFQDSNGKSKPSFEKEGSFSFIPLQSLANVLNFRFIPSTKSP